MTFRLPRPLAPLALAAALALPGAAFPTPPAQAAPAAVRAISQAEVDALLERWLAAQNQGDFAAYQAMYAARFSGVRRSGAVTAAFDRAGWMKDRAGMFKRAMRVEVTGVTIERQGATAVVQITQTWASGGYKDIGPKRLLLVREGDALRIAREEMLSSQVVGAATRAAEVPRDHVALVATLRDTPYVILGDGDATLAAGAPELLGDAYAFAARAKADPVRLDASWRAWQGREVTVFDAAGAACQAKVTDLWLLTRFQPHFGQSNQWLGTGDFEGEPPATPAEMARQGFGGAGTTVVAAALDGCSGVWAQAKAPSGASAPLREVVLDPALEKQVVAAFTRLPGYKSVQKDFTAHGHKGAWENYEGAVPRVAAFADDRGTRLVAISAQAGHGCGDFMGQLWAVWKVEAGSNGRTTLVLQTDLKEPGAPFLPVAVADVDGDGTLELMSEHVLMGLVDGIYRVVEDRTPLSFDCGC